jgi:ATP-dependent helicase HrpB
LLRDLGSWLAPYLNGITRRSQLGQLELFNALKASVDYAVVQQMESLAPTHLTAPTGTRIALDYDGAQPVMAVRLQEMFGVAQTPTIANGRVRVLMHLLSPAQRPLAVTQDLDNFWRNVYPDVRKDMRGQYPKHHWPENPLEAEPTRRSKASEDREKKRDAKM